MPTVAFDSRRFELQPDPPDDRDRRYERTTDAPDIILPSAFRNHAGPVLDQGREPSCTGMALAGVANYMLRRHWDPAAAPVSPRMMYEMARRHDRLSDEEEGSNLRGAIKGWYKHGVCSEALWPYTACTKHGRLNFERVVDAATRLMRGYVRIDKANIADMQSAVAEHGVLYAASMLHSGWAIPDARHRIPPPPHPGTEQGGHAFVIVGYDEDGFWLQNSWSTDWGDDGCAVLTYEDWLQNGLSVWAVEVDMHSLATGRRHAAGELDDSVQAMFLEMWPHVVVVGDDGKLTRHGSFAAAPEDLVALVEHFEEATQDWATRRLALIATAGIGHLYGAAHDLVTQRSELLEREIYPVFLLWKSDWLAPVTSLLEVASSSSSLEESSEWPLVRDALAELRRRAKLAIEPADGAGRQLIDHVLEAFVRGQFEIHLVSHGIGDALMSGVAELIAAGAEWCGARINSCTLWAPATTVTRFESAYAPLVERGEIEHVGIFALGDDLERSDTVGAYPGSPLLLLAETMPDLDGSELIGLERTLAGDEDLLRLREQGYVDAVIAPTGEPAHPLRRSTTITHTGFIHDEATLAATVGRILGHGEMLEFEIETRDPLVRARVVQRAKEISARRQTAVETAECGECKALRERAMA